MIKKLTRVFIAVIGACSIVFDMLTPIVITIYLLSFTTMTSELSTNLLLFGGIAASFYRGLKHLLKVKEIPRNG